MRPPSLSKWRKTSPILALLETRGSYDAYAQRVLGIACGYEDLNDHDTIRDDPLLAAAAGKRDPTGAERPRARDRGHGLAGKSTLYRLE